eukprot:TRINITY_DN673_c0_g1_i1.p1 TRINITY_DN673_c0_g1~~TRINITY_DN673_c0_g1_i1.p1  ORF type:complete len:487 (+),score=115.94 TRINITY_DN673_c0_g1_i1:50-1462(+)
MDRFLSETRGMLSRLGDRPDRRERKEKEREREKEKEKLEKEERKGSRSVGAGFPTIPQSTPQTDAFTHSAPAGLFLASSSPPVPYFVLYKLERERALDSAEFGRPSGGRRPASQVMKSASSGSSLSIQSLVTTDCSLRLLNELHLKEHLQLKIDGGHLHKGGNVVLLSTVLSTDGISPLSSCYFETLEVHVGEGIRDTSVGSDSESEGSLFLLCLLSAQTTAGATLFLRDLQRFTSSFGKQMSSLLSSKPQNPDGSFQLEQHSSDIGKLLGSWFETSVNYMSRVVSLLDETTLAVMLHTALVGREVRVLPHDGAEDMERFLDSLKFDAGGHSLSVSDESEMLVVDLVSGSAVINQTETNEYCREWAKELIALSPRNSLTLKKMIDDKKMAIMSSLNYVNKLVTSAKMDHYATYTAYEELTRDGNADVLLIMLLRDMGTSVDVAHKEVLSVLNDFYQSSSSMSVSVAETLF